MKDMKYYKITNFKENHKGVQYQTGLNVNIEPFRPYGNCNGGGIYFASKDILNFLNCGCWIREVILPDGEEFYTDDFNSITKYKAHRIILGERRKIDADIIRGLIEEGADVHVDEEYPLIWACKEGRYDIVKLLIEYGADVHARDDGALFGASVNGHIEVVRLLLKNGADIYASNKRALHVAKGNKYKNIVELLESYLTSK